MTDFNNLEELTMSTSSNDCEYESIAKNIHKIINADLRRSILIILLLSSSYQLDQILIGEILDYNGKNTTTSNLNNQLLWLKKRGFVTVDKISYLNIFMLTDQGLDVAENKIRVKGVRNLKPSEIRWIKNQQRTLGN